MQKIKIVLADDHPLVREGIKQVINHSDSDIEIIACFSNGRDILKAAKSKDADVYILDISMPILNGIETVQRLLKIDKKARVIFLSMHGERSLVERAFEVGAKGYLLKESAAEEIVSAIHEVQKGRFFITPVLSEFFVDSLLNKKLSQKEKSKHLLTSREREILQLISEGFGNKQIAVQLNVSLNTIHAHRNKIMRKLKIHKVADLIRFALREGITHL